MKTGISFVVLLSLVLFGISGQRSASADAGELFDQLIEALNADDVAAAVELFAEDAVMVVSGPGVGGGGGGPCPGGQCDGTTAIGNQLQGQVNNEHDFQLVAAEASNGTLTGSYELRSARTRELGIERIIFNFTLEEAGDKITSFTFGPDESDELTASFYEQRPGVSPPSTGDAGLAAAR